MADPDTFLDANSVRTNSPAWTTITTSPPLNITFSSRGPLPQTPIAFRSAALWDLQFSSTESTIRFGQAPPSTNDTATLPPSKDAVFGLVNPTTAPPSESITLANAFSKFNIGPQNARPEFLQFLQDLDGPGSQLPLTLSTASDARSGLWLLSGPMYRSVLSLDFVLPGDSAVPIEEFIKNHYGLSISVKHTPPPRIVLRIVTTHSKAAPGSTLIQTSSRYQLTVDVSINEFDLSLVFTPGASTMVISNPASALPSTRSVFDRLNTSFLSQNPSSNLGPSDLPDTNKPGPFNKLLKNIDFWYLTLQRSLITVAPAVEGDPFTLTLGPLYWRINLIAKWKDTFITLQYDSQILSFSGRLLFQSEGQSPYAKRLFDYDSRVSLEPTIASVLPNSIDLWSLVGISGAPKQIPHFIIAASLTFTKIPEDGGYTLALSSMVAKEDTPSFAVTSNMAAKEAFSWDMIGANAVYRHSAEESLTIQVFSEMSLNARPELAIEPAILSVNVTYNTGGSWILQGQVSDLSFALLESYFHPSVQKTATSILGGLKLKSLEAVYTYDSSGDASSFYISGAITLGDLELDLSYEYASSLWLPGQESAAQLLKADEQIAADQKTLEPSQSDAQWTFTATLAIDSPKSDLKQIVQALTGGGVVLPGFVGDITVNDPSDGSSGVSLILRSSGVYTAVSIIITIGSISATFVCLMKTGGKTKIILRIGLDQLPLVKNVPLVKELPQPFDKILYLWLKDDDGIGIVQEELDVINDELTDQGEQPIVAKKSTGDSSVPVIRAGHHFMVIDKDNVVLDHCFSDKDVQGDNAQQPPPGSPGSPDSNSSSAVGPTKGDIDKQLPFLSISAVSLMFKNGVLGVEMDATLRLGPITFSLLQFDLGIVLSDVKLDHLEQVPIKAGLHGLAVALKAPPVDVAGVFVYEHGEGVERYRGGVKLAFQTWKFLAVGEYAIYTNGTKSFFIYAKLNGPLFSIGFATVSGARVGLGYNSAVRSPAITELPKFPFLTDSADRGSGDDPLKIISAMTLATPSGPAWVSTKEDAYWVCAGLTLTAFGILSVTAVLMLQMQQTGFIISVFANGIAQIPCNVKPEATLFYVEIGMLAEIDTIEGYFTVQAALAPTSHVLVPACRLTGGFALCNWFDPSKHSGDFVFTVGGYHKAFQVPAWYPKVERIGVSFTLGSMINVSGGVYFAVTPKCVMGGGFLHMGLDVGPVSAWLDVALDVFIQFKPFHYMADLMVSVGVAISIKVWFVHVRISASVGAALHIEGPEPFGGYANVDFYLFSFTIHFGGNIKPPDPATIEEFYEMVRSPGPDRPPASSSTSEPVDPMMTRLKFTLTKGLFPQALPPSQPNQTTPFPDSGPAKGWTVKSGAFSFSIDCDFAISSALISFMEGTIFVSQDGIFSKPMQIREGNSISSNLLITIYQLSDTDPNVRTPVQGFTGIPKYKDVPSALWAPYVDGDDPARTANPEALRRHDNATVRLAMGIDVNMPQHPEYLQNSNLQPFDATSAFRETIGPRPFLIPSATPLEPGFLADSGLLPSAPPQQRYATFVNDWKMAADQAEEVLGAIGEDGAQGEGILKNVAHWLGWDNPSPSADRPLVEMLAGKRLPWQLSGSLPVGLVEGFVNEYSVLPRECVGVA